MSWTDLAKNQPKAVRILTNSLNNNRISHAYLFEGDAGVGKKEMAIYLAKQHFCKELNGIDPCGECSDCKRIDSGNHPDYHVVSIEEGSQSIKIEQIRNLQKEFGYKSVESAKKFYMIEDAEKMTVQAANSLLKFLEEPKGEMVAVLLTEQSHRILNTILSRCQMISFASLNKVTLRDRIKEEGINSSLAMVVSSLTNNYEKAIQLARDEWFLQACKIVVNITKEIHEKPQQAAVHIQLSWLPHFTERNQHQIGLDLLLEWYNDLLKTKIGKVENIVFTQQMIKQKEQADTMTTKQINEARASILEAKRRISSNGNPQIVLEQLVFQIIKHSLEVA